MSRTELKWGIPIPPETDTAWGAQANINHTGFTIVQDKQSTISPSKEASMELLNQMNSGGLESAGAEFLKLSHRNLLRLAHRPNTLYEDETLKIISGFEGSVGVLSITAYLKSRQGTSH